MRAAIKKTLEEKLMLAIYELQEFLQIKDGVPKLNRTRSSDELDGVKQKKEQENNDL